MLTILLYLLISLFVAVFVWEYIAKIKELKYKPSLYLSMIAALFMKFFELIGRLIAKISSFYTLFDFKQLIETLHDLIKPLIQLMISPYYTIKGYVVTMKIYNHSYLVPIGSLTLVVGMLYLVYVYFSLTPFDLAILVYNNGYILLKKLHYYMFMFPFKNIL